MRILVEHPIFSPYEQTIRGGTEMFVHRLTEALEVDVFGSADSTLPCIKSSAYSTQWMMRAKGGAKNDTKTKLWYDELGEASTHYDIVILNTSLSCCHLLDPARTHWYHKVIYFNHNSSNWFTRGFAGRQLNVILRYFRSFGAKTFYFSDANRTALEVDWADPNCYAHALAGKVDAGFKRIGHMNFLHHEPWTGKFNQAVACPATPRPPEGFTIAIGRDDPDKRLKFAEKAGALIITPDLGYSHPEVMDALSRADCLLLPSRNETFSIIAFEAMCHGVPVSYLERPPALDLYPSLAREWGDFEPNTHEERLEAHLHLSAMYSLEAFGNRLLQVTP